LRSALFEFSQSHSEIRLPKALYAKSGPTTMNSVPKRAKINQISRFQTSQLAFFQYLDLRLACEKTKL
jgi:hypothetical protein